MAKQSEDGKDAKNDGGSESPAAMALATVILNMFAAMTVVVSASLLAISKARRISV